MNKVILMGRLTRDPEVRYTQTNNTLVASFSLAVNRRFTKPGEERQADFINVVAWSKLGEFCSKYFKKVGGKLKWQITRKIKEIIIEATIWMKISTLNLEKLEKKFVHYVLIKI